MTHEVPILTVRYARRFVRFMEERGVGSQALLYGTGVSESMLENPDAFLSMKQIIAILRQAERLVQDETTAFEFGKQLDLVGHGLLGFALLHQRDHRELIKMIVQHLRVQLPMMDMGVYCSDETVCIRLKDVWDLGSLRPFMARMYMGSIYALTSLVCKNFSFEFDFSGRSAEWKKAVNGSDIFFDGNHNQVTMSLSERPRRDPDWQIAYYLADVRSREKPQINSAMEVVMQVRQQIMSNPGRDSTLDRVAQKLGMSARSVRRHLRLAGFTFHDIRTEIRETFATLYLADTRVPLERIAWRLGYSDQASFTKAYRSWTGKTPGSVRRKHQCGNGKAVVAEESSLHKEEGDESTEPGNSESSEKRPIKREPTAEKPGKSAPIQEEKTP